MEPLDVSALDASALNIPIPALALTYYSIKNLQLMIKVCMDSIFQTQIIYLMEPANHQKGQLKARLSDFYYGKSHIECYHLG